VLRRAARNQKLLGQVAGKLVNLIYPGADASEPAIKEVVDLRKPASISVDFETTANIRAAGRELAVKFPILRSGQAWSLTRRTLPLVFEYAQVQRHDVTVELPPGARVKRLPRKAKLTAPCSTFERSVTRDKTSVTITTIATTRCARMEASAYGEHRALWQESGLILDDELVLTVR
jgi:hypothetical protein